MSMTTTCTATTARRSWADIVKKGQTSEEEAAVAEPPLAEDEIVVETSPDVTIVSMPNAEEEILPKAVTTSPEKPPGVFDVPVQPAAVEAAAFVKPGERGSLQCFCRGEVLSMLSHYGWLKVYGQIDHPLAWKHMGRIYVQSKDILDGQTLKEGDTVSFYLYADDVGLGAEACQSAAKEQPVGQLPMLRAGAAEFVPGSAKAEPVADMFLRMSRTFKSIPANGYVQMVGVNSSYFDLDDFTDDEDDDSSDADKESVREESGNSSEEEVCTSAKQAATTKVAEASPPWRKTKQMALKCDASASLGMTSDSTTAGASSDDSETEMQKTTWMKAIKAGRLAFPGPAFRPPPGLEDLVPSWNQC